MLLLQEYLKIKNISERTAYRWISSGSILPLYKQVNGSEKPRLFIIDPELEPLNNLSKPARLAIIKDKRAEWDVAIKQAHINKELTAATVRGIVADAEHFNNSGFKINGYTQKSIYRKIANNKTERKERNDKFVKKNHILKAAYDKLVKIARHFYEKNSNKSLNYTCDLIKIFAGGNIDFIELAAIPKSTMYKALKEEWDAWGMQEIHDFKNHHNLWNAKKAKVTGAFTDDIEFMDYIIGDDHKADVAKVLVFNPLRNNLEVKTIYSWFWSEAKTQKVLAYVLKTSEITTDDLKLSLIEALNYAGRPNKAILVDNGIGRSVEFQNCAVKLGCTISYSKPYQPTEKSPGERIFGLIKNEHDCFYNNFTGSNHAKEGRHEGLSLTPANPDYTFDDFKKGMALYIENVYDKRPRRKRVNGKTETVCIGDLFFQYWQSFTPSFPGAVEQRDAYLKRHIAKFNEELTFKGETYTPYEFLGPVYNNRKYEIAYNPNDLTNIDLIALETFKNNYTGEIHHKGTLITTLVMTSALDKTIKQGHIAKLNAKRKKTVKELANIEVDMTLIQNPALMPAINSTVDNGGKITPIRKLAVKKAENAIKYALPKKDVIKFIEEETADNAKTVDELFENDPLFNGSVSIEVPDAENKL